MKKYTGVFIAIVVIAVLAIIKIKFLTVDAPPAMQKPGKNQTSTVTAYVVKPVVLDNKIFSTGTVLSNEETVLVPEVAGKIIAINFKEGSRVSKGDMLVKINDADLQAQLKKFGVQEKLAAQNEAREKKLLDINGISQAEYDAALTQLNTVKADIELTQAQIAKTEIHAPFNGTIGLKYVSEGSFVTPTTATTAAIKIATLQQIDPVKIDFSVPEKYSSAVQLGDSVLFTVQGSDEKFKGEIYAIEPKIDLSTRTIQLRAICQNRNGKIFPGSFAKIDLILKKTSNTVLIPTEALIPELKGQKVFLCKNGRARSQKVETGIRLPEKIQITNGLQAGDTVITTGIMQLRDSSLVKIISVK
ncbi:MAG TPA: efflux RND transporter periplasmic adaptor subunit [Bacteroidia bacterium]